MARKKSYTLDDVAGSLIGKPIATESLISDDVVFDVRGLTEQEYIYLMQEAGKGNTEAEKSYIALHLAPAFGIVKIYKLVDGEKHEVKLERNTVSIMGDEIAHIPTEVIRTWDLKLRENLCKKVTEMSDISTTEGKKLEFFRESD